MSDLNIPYVGVVIVNYNGEKYQNECIKSLIDSGYDNMKIIVVDNASSDKSMELLKEIEDERILAIYNSENGGVAQGNNIGIKKSIELGCDYTLLLNNDTVLTKDFLQVLVQDGEDIAVPKIYFYNTDKILWYAGGKFIKHKGLSAHINYAVKDENIKFKKYYDYAPTCCLLFKNAVFEKIGFMDENYFLYFDDSDLTLRANRAGYKIRFYENSVMYHKVSLSTGGETSPTSLYYCTRNRFYFINKFKFGAFAKLFTYFTRKLKILSSKLKKDKSWIYIKEAMRDYKKGNMFRKDNLKELEAEYK